MLLDRYGRMIDYARLAITDRCNLRCMYCMPQQVAFLKKKELLSFEEIVRLLNILSSQGIKKIRYTGGEPFMRADFIDLLNITKNQTNIAHISITTNGTLINKHIPLLKNLVETVTVSLDSLNPEKLQRITKCTDSKTIFHAIDKLIDQGINTKLNMVVMDSLNTDEIKDFINLTEHKPIAVRFIEEMPFNGKESKPLHWDHIRILEHIQTLFNIESLPDIPNSTATYYKVKNFIGSFGIIPAYSRTFCGSCNRLRITPQGFIKTCLYEKTKSPLLPLLRDIHIADQYIANYIQECISKKPLNGFVAEQAYSHKLETMNRIGG